MMTTQEMKRLALDRALKGQTGPGVHPDGGGRMEIESLTKKHRLVCSCYQLTQFSFYIETARGTPGDYSLVSEISENAAWAFLRALE